MSSLTVLIFLVILFASFIGLIIYMPRIIQAITEAETEGTKAHRFDKESGFRGRNISSGMVLFMCVSSLFTGQLFEGTVILILILTCYFGFLHYKVLSGIKVPDTNFYIVLSALVGTSLYFNIALVANWSNVFMTTTVSIICGLIWGAYTVYVRTLSLHNKP